MSTQLIGAPPTDSLYKFMALTGLALLVLSLVYPTRVVLELELRTADLDAEVTKLEHEADFQARRAELLADPMRQMGQADQVALLQTKMELKIKQSDARSSQAKLRILISQARLYLWAGSIGVALGSCLTIFGFTLWYHKVQLPADKEVAQKSGM